MASRAVRSKRKLPPCSAACPAKVNVQGYIALIQQGKFRESVELIRKNMPFPAICGRICFSPCQDACTRKDIDEPVGIRYLKRLAADVEREQGRTEPEPVPKRHEEKVAIIGAGPAGLSAAYELAKAGYPVTIFERMPKPGGMMTYGIPDYRLRKYVVANEIEYIKDLGVEIKTELDFGKDFDLETLQGRDYKAVFMAIGAQLSQKLEVPGENFEGVLHAVDFLRDISLGRTVVVGERVAVVGGGNSAIDAARTSVRLGAKVVTILYRRSRKEMPALPIEVEAAEREGVKIEFLVTPTRIIGENERVKGIECQRMTLGEPDKSGRRRPIPIHGSEHVYNVNTVICAIGQRPEVSCIPTALRDERGRGISTDPLTLETNIQGVFAGGDIATGPASVIEAVAAGRRAAESIDRHLNCRDLRLGRQEELEEMTWFKEGNEIAKKPERYTQTDEDTGRYDVSFFEADELLGKTKKAAVWEAHRCLECGPCSECLGNEGLCEADKAIVDEALCTGCNVCAGVCPFNAIAKNEREIAQVDEDLCKGCGVCGASCPEQAISMRQVTNSLVLARIASVLEEAKA